MVPFIDLKPQRERIEINLKKRWDQILDHGSYILGPEVGELECALAGYTGSKFVVACANGTDALQLSLMAIGCEAGDEVICPDFSFFATSECASILGVNPVFVDVNEKTYNLDPNSLEAAITEKTKAIIVVSLYGQCADYDEINAIAQKHGIKVIEDAAQSFGAEYKGKKSCNLTDIACTSFFPTKPLGCFGDGGALFTNDETLGKKLAELRAHGASGRYYHTSVGINSRLDSLQAAVLLEKLAILPDEIKLRNEIAARYDEGLKGIIDTPFVEDHNLSVYAQYTIRVPNREKFMETMKEKGVPTMVHYPRALSEQPVYKGLNFNNPISKKVAEEVVSLPFYPYLSNSDQAKVIEAVKGSL